MGHDEKGATEGSSVEAFAGRPRKKEVASSNVLPHALAACILAGRFLIQPLPTHPAPLTAHANSRTRG